MSTRKTIKWFWAWPPNNTGFLIKNGEFYSDENMTENMAFHQVASQEDVSESEYPLQNLRVWPITVEED